MNSTLSTAGPPSDIAIDVRSSRHDSGSKRARHQTALMALGRQNLADLEATQLAYDVVALLAKTLDATLCALVEVMPNASPPAADRVVSIPPEAAHSGPQSGVAIQGDALLSAALGKSARLLVADVQTDERYRRTWCHRQGVRSAMAISLVLHGQPLGTLVVGHATAGYYDEDDLLFLELIGNLLAAHLARAKAEEAMHHERQYVAALLDSTSALTVTLNATGIVTRVNRACLTLTGLRQDQVVGQPFWLTLCIPNEARLSEASFAQLSADVAAVEFESTLHTAGGDRRFVGWRMCYLLDPRELVPVVVATGVDMTRQRQAEQDAQQAIVAAEAARRLVEELRTLQPATNGRQANAATETPPQAAPKRGAERRTSQRKLFPYRQQIAPFDDGIVPPRHTFAQVRCWDISAGGISFLLDEPPPYKRVVVVLGGSATEVLMSADVVRVIELVEEDVNGYLVGCRFTGKL